MTTVWSRLGVALSLVVVVACGDDGDNTPAAVGVDQHRDAGDGDRPGDGDAGDGDDMGRPDGSFSFDDLGMDGGGPASEDPPPRTPPETVSDGWTCTRDYALDTICDCGCGAPDLVCDPPGCVGPGCGAPGCELCFDANGVGKPCGAYDSWVCAPGKRGDGVCDCGCGEVDPDCADGSCVEPGCVASICERCANDHADTVDCDLLTAFACDGDLFGDGKCDCGCGNHDVDCTAGSCVEAGCYDAACDVCHDRKGAAIDCSAPDASWSCSADAREDGVCDCGCGIADPDCAGDGCSRGGCDEDACEVCHDALGRVSPCADRWTCPGGRFGDGVCDCGCGAADPDCDGDGCSDGGCEADACERRYDKDGKPLKPAAYTCDENTYGKGDGCDCGCGAIDLDCGDAGCSEAGCTAPACDACHADDGSLFECDWYCAPEAAGGNGVCDCGCGAPDPDCTATACFEGSCFATGCQVCHDSTGKQIACERTMCPSGYTSNGTCDCGCREKDPECPSSNTCLEPGCSGEGCGICHAADGTPIPCEDWQCTFEKQGGDSCNCGCGARDPDCPNNGGCALPGCVAPGCVTCRAGDGSPMACEG